MFRPTSLRFELPGLLLAHRTLGSEVPVSPGSWLEALSHARSHVHHRTIKRVHVLLHGRHTETIVKTLECAYIYICPPPNPTTPHSFVAAYINELLTKKQG